MTRAADIKLIHIAKASLAMDDDTYRQILARHGDGKTSCTDLSDAQLRAVMRHLKDCGFKVKTQPGRPQAEQDPQGRKLRALWWALADAGAVNRPADAAACDAAIEAWAKRQLAGRTPPLDALRFASVEQLRELTEQLKQWCQRLGILARGGHKAGAAVAAMPAGRRVTTNT